MKEFIEKCRQWQKKNSDWELLCDIDDTDQYWQQWHELPKSERMSWVGAYGRDAKAMFEEFGKKRPKIEMMVLDRKTRLLPLLAWPEGVAMTVYRTKIEGVPVLGDFFQDRNQLHESHIPTGRDSL